MPEVSTPQEPAIIELGTEPPEPPEPGRRRRWSPHLAYALAALAGVALFASLAGEWATITQNLGPAIDQGEAVTGGIESIGGWGTGWVVGAVAVAASLGLSLFGPVPLRAAARAVGLAVTGALAGVLVALTTVVGQHGFPIWGFRPLLDIEVELGRGLYAGYAALVLLAAALWLARSAQSTYPAALAAPAAPATQPAEPAEPAAVAGPGEVTVARAEPVAYPDQRHEWR